jgi:diguanylate cyclase (GGDEF)-like protein
LTDFLGGIYKQNIQAEARGDIDLLASRLAGETTLMEAMVKVLAGAPSVAASLISGSQQDVARSKSMLDLDVGASDAKRGYIVDRSGKIIASSDRQSVAAGGGNAGTAPYFQTSIAGEPSNQFVFNAMSKERNFYASYPIRAGSGTIVGVAVLVKSLNAFEADLQQFDRPYFFIDPDGVVVLTNRPKMLFRTLWALSPEKRLALSQQFGTLDDRPILQHEVVDATWANIDGERGYVRRRNAHLSQWSLVILNPTREIFASRVLGIVITLLVTIMTLIYIFGRERWVHDKIQQDKRLQLQELALELGLRATTDPLTGLSNRLKFDQALANELLRSDRYKMPLSLVFCDVDYFKAINDSRGHLAGDKVLIELSRLVASHVRTTDVFARWGGEEFALLFPGSDAAMAYQAAEKLREAIAQSEFEGGAIVTCSFGVAQYVEGDTPETFISRADAALYRAKINGRNRVELAAKPVAGEPSLRGASYSI